MNDKIRALWAFCIVITSFTIAGQAAPLVSLSRKYKEGQVFYYQVMETNYAVDPEDPGDGDLETTNYFVRILVKFIKPNNVVLAKTRVKSDEDPNGTFVTLDRFGKIVDTSHPGTDYDAQSDFWLWQLGDILLPPRPVGVGSTWKTSLPNRFLRNEPVVVRTTLVGAEDCEGKKCWRVKQSAAVVTEREGESQVILFRLVSWIDATTNYPLKSLLTTEDSPMIFQSVFSVLAERPTPEHQ
jgi:hypothetical protein